MAQLSASVRTAESKYLIGLKASDGGSSGWRQDMNVDINGGEDGEEGDHGDDSQEELLGFASSSSSSSSASSSSSSSSSSASSSSGAGGDGDASGGGAGGAGGMKGVRGTLPAMSKRFNGIFFSVFQCSGAAGLLASSIVLTYIPGTHANNYLFIGV